MSSKAWYLVYTKPQKEVLACRNLEQQEYTVYLPFVSVHKRRRGVLKKVSEPMFSRYLFIHLDKQHDNWSPIRSTVGVVSLVRFGMVPARLPDDFIARLQQSEQEEAEVVSRASRFNSGDKVTITQGPFSGYEAIFHTSKSSDRAIILLEIANRYSRLQIETDLLDKA